MGKSDSEDACTGKKYEHHAIALNLFPFSHLNVTSDAFFARVCSERVDPAAVFFSFDRKNACA
jgi:hypothetical protein